MAAETVIQLGRHFADLGERLRAAGFGDDVEPILNNYAAGVHSSLDAGWCPRCAWALVRAADTVGDDMVEYFTCRDCGLVLERRRPRMSLWARFLCWLGL